MFTQEDYRLVVFTLNLLTQPNLETRINYKGKLDTSCGYLCSRNVQDENQKDFYDQGLGTWRYAGLSLRKVK